MYNLSSVKEKSPRELCVVRRQVVVVISSLLRFVVSVLAPPQCFFVITSPSPLPLLRCRLELL